MLKEEAQVTMIRSQQRYTLMWQLSCLVWLLLAVLLSRANAAPLEDASAKNLYRSSFPSYASINPNAEPHEDVPPYELIDVAEQSSNGSQVSTGHTTRIFTTGDVDDAFWMRHLGEDFKNAIHLQVGENERHDEVYSGLPGVNVTSTYSDAPAETLPATKSPITSNSPAKNSGASTQQYPVVETPCNGRGSEGKCNATVNTRTETSASTENASSAKASSEFNHKSSDERRDEGQRDSELPYNARPFCGTCGSHKNPHRHVHSVPYTKSYGYGKYGAAKTYTLYHPKSRNAKRDQVGMEEDVVQTPVVVDLPETSSDIVQLEDSQSPIVVKMPPVIYHSIPAYDSVAQARKAAKEEKETPNSPPNVVDTDVAGSKSPKTIKTRSNARSKKLRKMAKSMAGERTMKSDKNNSVQSPSYVGDFNSPVTVAHEATPPPLSAAYPQFDTPTFEEPPFESSLESSSATGSVAPSSISSERQPTKAGDAATTSGIGDPDPAYSADKQPPAVTESGDDSSRSSKDLFFEGL